VELSILTGDVTNAGLENANAVTINRALRQLPRPVQNYVVGVLKPDDFGSFEVSFSTRDNKHSPSRFIQGYRMASDHSTTEYNLATATSSDRVRVQTLNSPHRGGNHRHCACLGGYLYMRNEKPCRREIVCNRPSSLGCCENLPLKSGDVTALNHISFEVRGEFISIMGPSGSGKSPFSLSWDV